MDARADLVERLDAALPQSQCRRCGYRGCRPFAAALASGEASPNGCPPGGEATRGRLAAILGVALDPPAPVHAEEPPRAAFVHEPDCIGCTHCIRACPVDAIVGAAGMMHTVVARWCTGCALCVPVCPTDCIELRPASQPGPTPAMARARHRARNAREAAREAPEDLLLDVAGASPATLRAQVIAAVARRRGRGA